MKINKEIYYHANSGDIVNIGDVLVFNSLKHNKMYDEVYNREFKINNIDANEILIIKKKNKDNNLNAGEFNIVLDTINNDAFVLRELALEEVRKDKFPSYPSRLNCLYITKEKEDAINWSNILKRNQKQCKQILTLECSGELFVGDGNLMKRQNLSYKKHLENAEKYWSSNNPIIPEYLFYGEAKVIDIENIN